MKAQNRASKWGPKSKQINWCADKFEVRAAAKCTATVYKLGLCAAARFAPPERSTQSAGDSLRETVSGAAQFCSAV